MDDDTTKIEIDDIFNFGFCPQGEPEIDEDGAMVFTYRAVPLGLIANSRPGTCALLNEAGRRFAVCDAMPPGFAPPDPEPPPDPNDSGAWLDEEGRKFFDSCPLYAVLRLKEPYVYWQQMLPGGEPAFEIRARDYNGLIDMLLRASPVERCARTQLQPWREFFDVGTDGDIVPVMMQLPLQGDLPSEKRAKPENEPKDEDWERSNFEVPVVHVNDRVDRPGGVHKVIYLSCHPDYAHVYWASVNGPGVETIEVAHGWLEPGDSEFHWNRHVLWRFEGPLCLMPRVIEEIRRLGHEHPGNWALKASAPCHQADLPIALFNQNREPEGWLIRTFVFETLAKLGDEGCRQIEADLRELYSRSKPE
ncbi:MAG TPA: hypothetical protein PLL78_02780 [Fimbriimonadaceae bacterium]|nr:hypothetical protein [Fimbriimonadaceae bacterium]HRJ95585.1 hypothetical protein [Fimbriimonadaceae bacterium]